MHITIINDCADANAAARQTTRVASLFSCGVSYIGVKNDLEAAGNIVDILDAFGKREGVILVNVAPRSGSAKKWENGTPFGYFWYENTLVVSTIDGHTLSLVKKFKLAKQVNVFDIPTALQALIDEGELTEGEQIKISESQFRSFDFLPLAAYYIHKGYQLPTAIFDIAQVEDIEPAFWWVDNFGNGKTTITQNEVTYKEGESITTNIGIFPFHKRLCDVPDDHVAFVVGSSDAIWFALVTNSQSKIKFQLP